MTELVTGYAGAPHVSSDDAGRCWAGIVGSDCYVLPTMDKLECTVVSANSVEVAPGDAMMMGRHVTVTSTETLTIDSGSMGMGRHDIIGIRYTKDSGTQVESAALVVIKGTPDNPAVDPTLPAGNILDGDLDAFMPLWRIVLDGLSVGDPERLFSEVATLEDATGSVDELSRITMGTNNAELVVDAAAYWTQDNGLLRMVFTTAGNIRVDSRESTSDPWATLGYALVTNNAGYTATENTVLAAPNGSNGAVSMRKLVANDIPNLPASKITSGQLANGRMPSSPTFTSLTSSAATVNGDLTLKTGSALWSNTNGIVHVRTGEVGTKQAEYTFEYDGIYRMTRTRTSSSQPWGAWSAWTKVTS